MSKPPTQQQSVSKPAIIAGSGAATKGVATPKPAASKNVTATPVPAQKTVKIPLVSNIQQLNSMIQEAGNKVVFIQFIAEWCGPCKLVGHIVEELAAQYEGKVVFIKIDVDELDEYALQVGVTSMPACLYLRGGQKLDLISGSNVERIKKTLEKYANPDKDAIQTVKTPP